MEIDFWQQRWHENQTGFHLSDVNPCLVKYWSELDIADSSTIFVPLCGKSLDLVWLASQQYSVLGVECSEKAVKEFFSEQQLSMQQEIVEDFNIYNNENIKILQGDFFKLNKKMLADVSAVYDRASLVALPELMRRQYAQFMLDILPDSVSMLLVTLEYDQSLMSGPPFSLSDNEVQRLYGSNFKVELLNQQDVIKNQPRFKERGIDYMLEQVYKISR